MNAVIYARFSPRPDASESESLDVQIARCQAYCKMMNFTIVSTFLDPEVSARKIPLNDREAGRTMIEYIRANKIEHLIVVRLDRIFRSSLDGHSMMALFKSLKCNVHFADQNGCSLNTGSAVGAMLFSVLLAFAEFEPMLTAERTSKALHHKQNNGQLVSREPIYGKMRDPENPKRTVPCKEEQRIIETIAIHSKEGVSPKLTAKFLNNSGFRRRGHYWSAEFVQKIIGRLAALNANNPL